jgi:hypothetical protein
VGGMSYAVVTTFSPRGYEVYGRRMIDTFAKYWPEDIPLYVYYEGSIPGDASPRAVWRCLDDDKDRKVFMSKYRDGDPRDYRTCVVRYSHKVWAMTSCPRDADNLLFLDADCETFTPVTDRMLKGVVPDPGQVCAFLDRPYHRHSETGFLSFRMGNCGGDFLDEFRRMYTSGDIFNLNELHDCMAFDFVRRKFQRAGHTFKNLCPTANGLSVFEKSELKHFIRHNKGPVAKLEVYGDSMSGMEEVA